MPHLGEVIAHLFHPRRSNNHRPRILHPEALLMLTFVAVGFTFLVYRTAFFSDPLGSVLGYAADITAAQVVELTNQQRTNQGMQPLAQNEQLARAAAAKADDMFNNQYWAHVSPTGVQPWAFIADADYTYQWAGENLARDFAHSPEMITAWMNSPTHRANILHAKYTQIGVAVVNGVLQGQETTLVVQMFGTPKVRDAAISEQATQSVSKEFPTSLQPANETDTQINNGQVMGDNLLTAQAMKPSVESTLVAQEQSLPPVGLSPLQLIQSFFLAMLVCLITVLFYDLLVASNKNIIRLVGKNMAHISIFFVVAFLIVFFKSGLIK